MPTEKKKKKMNTSIRAEKKKYKKQEADYRNIVGNTCIADVYSYLADLHGKGCLNIFKFLNN